MKRPTESDFEINVGVEAIFKPTTSHYSYNRLVDEKDIARFGPISPARVRHAGPTGDTADYDSADVEAMAFGLSRRSMSLEFQHHQCGGVCMASMKKEEARRAVLGEYDKWAKKHPNDATMMGGFLFFRYLQNERTDLLDFRASDNDKWQIVHGWLRDWVKD
jgi:hypothetical protein